MIILYFHPSVGIASVSTVRNATESLLSSTTRVAFLLGRLATPKIYGDERMIEVHPYTLRLTASRVSNYS